MDKINNNLFEGFTDHEKLLADKLNGLIDGLNNVIIPKIDELIDSSANLNEYLTQLAQQLNAVANTVNSIAAEVESQLDRITEIDVHSSSIGLAFLSKRRVFLSLDYESPMMFLRDHEVATAPTVFLTDREAWRIDLNGNYKDDTKQRFYYNKDEIANKLRLYAVKTSENTSEYPITELDGGITEITYPSGDASCYEEDGTQKIDKSKPVKEGYFEYSLNWEWRHDITPVNPDTYLKDVTDLDYVALANVPTLYDVFAGSELHYSGSNPNAPYKNRILDEYYGGQEKILSSSTYGNLAFTTADWWWTTGNDHVRFGRSLNAPNSRNIDTFDNISNPSGTGLLEYHEVTKNIYIADGATIRPYVKYRVGDDNTKTVTQYNSTVSIPQSLDTLTINTDLGSITGLKQYVAIRPRMDAILAGLTFVLPGSGWGETDIDWNDFVSRPQYYVDQCLGKTVWPGPDSSNQRDQECSYDVELYYSGAPASIWQYTGVNKNTEVYCTTGYSEGQYFYGPNKVGYTEFINNRDAIASLMKRTKYQCVNKMYYWNDGNISVDYPDSSITRAQYKFWLGGPIKDYATHALTYNQRLKAGDIFIVLCNPHSKSIQVSAIKGNFEGNTVRDGSFVLNTGLDSQQASWSAESGWNAGLTTAKDIMNCTNAQIFKNINVPCEDIVGDHHHDTQTLLQSDPQSPFLYKRYGGRDYNMYAYQIGEDMLLKQLSFWPYYE